MKYTLSLMTAGLIATGSFAQDGFYIAPSAGAGISGATKNYTIFNAAGNAIKNSDVVNYNSKAAIGYRYKKFRFQVGIQYMTSGYKRDEIVFPGEYHPDSSANTKDNSPFEVRYTHLMIPVQVGYNIRVSNKFSVVPYLGILAGYNLGAKTFITEAGKERSYTLTKADFNNRYNRLSLWGQISVQAEYRLGPIVSLTAGPSVTRMISNLEQVHANAIVKPTQKNYAFNLDIGAKISL